MFRPTHTLPDGTPVQITGATTTPSGDHLVYYVTDHVSPIPLTTYADQLTPLHTPVAVEIQSVFPDTIKIPARFLQPGDQVHDAHGTRYALTTVRRLTGGTMSTRREDQRHTEHWEPTEPITVAPRNDVDPLHQRRPGDVLIRRSDQTEYVILRVITTNLADVRYLVRPLSLREFYAATVEMTSQEFMKP